MYRRKRVCRDVSRVRISYPRIGVVASVVVRKLISYAQKNVLKSDTIPVLMTFQYMAKTTAQKFGENMKKFRLEKGMSQRRHLSIVRFRHGVY